MGSIFEEFGITWQGVEYVVPPGKVMGLVEIVEDIITIEELHGEFGPKRAKLARALSVIISYAGGNLSQEEIYTKFFSGKGGEEARAIINTILMLMIPPEHLQATKPKKPARKKVAARTKRAKG